MNTQVQRDKLGVVLNQSQNVKKFAEQVRTAVGWTNEIKVFGSDEARGILVVQIAGGSYYLVHQDAAGEPWFFHINKGRDPKFS